MDVDWTRGPVGPGFLMLFANELIQTFGGGRIRRAILDDKCREEESSELLALLMLLRE